MDQIAHYHHSVVDGFDAEALLGVVRDARFEQRLLAPGHFRACLQRLVFPRFSLDSGDYSLPIFASGSFGKDVVALALALSCKQPMWANGEHVAAGQLLLFAEDSELNVRPSPGGWHWAVLLIEREVLQTAALYRLGHALTLPRSGWCCCDPSVMAAALCRIVYAVLEDASRWDALVSPGKVALQGDVLLGAFIDAADGDERQPRHALRERGAWMVQRRDELIRKAEDFLRRQLDSCYDGLALSTLLGIGERRVERLFQDAYGLSPHSWHHVARLNAARQALIVGSQHGEGVTDVAIRLGFTHLGRFSTEYRKIFGESPRDTLRS